MLRAKSWNLCNKAPKRQKNNLLPKMSIAYLLLLIYVHEIKIHIKSKRSAACEKINKICCWQFLSTIWFDHKWLFLAKVIIVQHRD